MEAGGCFLKINQTCIELQLEGSGSDDARRKEDISDFPESYLDTLPSYAGCLRARPGLPSLEEGRWGKQAASECSPPWSVHHRDTLTPLPRCRVNVPAKPYTTST